ncbi:MAG TPA: dTMP kinase [Candidatus Hydrogenedentes bacterium]|nr:dTMP kinase [Candidatus Hydrogenedentota bacterium]
MRGVFITLEGVEGGGKSTQIGLLARHFEDQGRVVMVTREPGGTTIGEAIRGVLLDPDFRGMTSLAEAFLYEAARAQHVAERIGPAIESGSIVLCDRFVDSTVAYQCAGRALDRETIVRLNALAVGGAWPDLTIVLDVPVAEGLERAKGVGAPDRLEQESVAFHERVRAEFRRLAEEEPGRVKVVDAGRAIDAVFAEVRAHADVVLAARGGGP